MLRADRMDKRRGVYRNTVVGRSNSSLACSTVRNPTCGFFVEFSCGFFQLSLRERTLLHEDRLLVCVVTAILAQCHHIVNRFFGAGMSFFCVRWSGRAHVLAWCGFGMGWAHPPRARRLAPAGPWDP